MKKQTKRMVSLALALVFCLGLGTMALADDYEDDVYYYEGPQITLVGDAWAQELLNEETQAPRVAVYLMGEACDAGVTQVDCTRTITRREFAGMAVALWEFANPIDDLWYGEGSDTPFSDVDDPYVTTANSLGLVNGTSETTFEPDAPLTREQAATILLRVSGTTEEQLAEHEFWASFADEDQISDWAKPSVLLMAERGVITGVGENMFAPQKTLTVQEALIMARRESDRYDALPDPGGAW